MTATLLNRMHPQAGRIRFSALFRASHDGRQPRSMLPAADERLATESEITELRATQPHATSTSDGSLTWGERVQELGKKSYWPGARIK